jgi:hypothetical protein
MKTHRSRGLRSATGVALVSLAGCGGVEDPAVAPAQPSVVASAPAPHAAPAPAPERASAASLVTASAPAASAPSLAKTPEPEAAAPVPAAAPPAPEPQLPLAELLVQRDLWPPRVALVRPLTIERGVTLPVGHELAVYEFNGSFVTLYTGSDIFDVPVDQTDVLERAFATKAALTPEQLALTPDALVARPELWPESVRTTRRLAFQAGKELPVGTEAAVRTLTPGWVNLFAPELGDHFQAEAFETDLVARARERLRLPESERAPFFVRSLAAALDAPPEDAAALVEAGYVLVYRARLGCTRCAAFAPELAAAYTRLRAADPRFEAVFYSDDRSAEDARAVMEREQLPGRALRFDRRLAAADLASRSGQLLPLVYLYDRAGTLISQNHPNGGSPGARDVLATLEAKLAETR